MIQVATDKRENSTYQSILRAGHVALLVDHLASMHETLGTIPVL